VGQGGDTIYTPTSAALKTQRQSRIFTFTDAAVERVLPFYYFNYTSGNPIDLTLRIAAPQLEQGAFPTSYIPTTTAAATRAADSAVVTPIASFYNQAEGTLFAEYQRETLNTTYAQVASIDTTSGAERISLATQGGTGRRVRITIGVNNVLQWDEFNIGDSSVWPVRTIVALKASDYAASIQGQAPKTQSSGLMPAPDGMAIGGRRADSTKLNGHIRKIAYWPKRLTNTLLQQLTA
jgi:hypothetical protein